jgi:hypothetical protein
MQEMPNAIPTPESPDLPPPIPPGQKKSKNTWIIVLVVAVVLCCLCSCIGIVIWVMNGGQDVLNEIQKQMGMLSSLV